MTFKELMSEVLGVEVLYYKVLDNTLSYQAKDKYQTQAINIYELAHKCKEWAVEKSYVLETSYEGVNKHFGKYCICRVFFDGNKVYDNYTNSVDYEKEVEAIFKACEWIMEQTKC